MQVRDQHNSHHRDSNEYPNKTNNRIVNNVNIVNNSKVAKIRAKK